MVKVIAGKDKDKEGKVIAVNTKKQYRSGRGYQHGDKTCKTKHGIISRVVSSIRRDLLTFQTLCISQRNSYPRRFQDGWR